MSTSKVNEMISNTTARAATPALTAPQTITVPFRGSIRRDSTPGTPVISVPRPYTRSPVRCGRDVCPPCDCSVTSSWSAAEVIGPARSARSYLDIPSIISSGTDASAIAAPSRTAVCAS